MLKFLTFISVILSIMELNGQMKSDYNPMFFSMNNEWKEITKDESIFEFTVKSLDTIYNTEIAHTVKLLSNNAGEPKLFFSDIETTVCADGECKIANIKVYWNLLGNYVGYGIYPEYPLTKFEHDEFEKEDYAKLHKLLSDDNSILKRRKMSDLIDKVPVAPSNTNLSKDMDGVSGATKREVKESVVKGGLYSCYTLWHIVHGPVKDKMKDYMLSLNTSELNRYFLYTPYKDYQLYALKQLDKTKFKTHSEQIIKIFKTTDALTKSYILKKIPSNVLSEEKITVEYYSTFPDIDINSRTLLLKKIKFANPISVNILSRYLDYLTKNQMELYLKYLESVPNHLYKKIKGELVKMSKNKNYPYSYLVIEFLKNRK
ncbi:hypothetical protein [Maribacter ulvicola]|uniref:Uncharacterized protein n=1 Tax=Maribacter ulvicola TaxID=228959 RepID=A0A1N6X7A0_9FLAO|nr:hypothetical protein [Maribacter ulvicola]SIQ98206.1 hypothetical protein SAMN05421797_10515 [Maribacter ulvicola]